MIGSAFVKGGQLNLRFEWFAISGKLEKAEYALGAPLLDFIWMEDEMVDKVFQMVMMAFLSSHKGDSNIEDTLEYMNLFVERTLEKNLYLYFYQSAFVAAMITGATSQKKAVAILKEYLLDDCDLVNLRASDSTVFSGGICAVLTADVKRRKRLLLEDLNALSGENEIYSALSPMQRMYLLISSGKNYLSGEFTTTLLPDFAFEEDAGIAAIKKAIETEKVDIVEMTNIDTLNDLIRFELFHTIKENLTIKKCGFCGGYFIPRGRSDIEYCNRIKFGEKKRCSEIGAFRKRENLLKDEPVHKKHNAAVKRMNKRKHTGWISDDEYSAWSKQAIKMRDECLGGKISVEAFEEWLDKTSRVGKKSL
jgi:hypothetical protein